MALRSESQNEIAGGVHDVFTYIADVSRWPEWAAAIRECRVRGGGALQAGSHLDQRVRRAFGSTGSRELHVTAVDAPARLTFAGAMGSSPLQWGFDLAPLDSSRTALQLWVDLDRRGPMRAMPKGLLRSMIQRVNARELAAIKSAVE